MSARIFIQSAGVAVAALLFAGCAAKPYDYTNYRAHPPRSIVILPPLNESMKVTATYGYLATVTKPVAERGYYVFPVEVVDQFLKENGLPTPGEMHQVPLNKVVEILGADAVLYLTIEKYGSKYQVVNSATVVQVNARLVDTRTGTLLWERRVTVQQNSGGSGGLGDLISAAITQVINSSIDAAHELCTQVNDQLFNTKGQGLLYGPYSPLYGKDE